LRSPEEGLSFRKNAQSQEGSDFSSEEEAKKSLILGSSFRPPFLKRYTAGTLRKKREREAVKKEGKKKEGLIRVYLPLPL